LHEEKLTDAVVTNTQCGAGRE